MGGVLYLRVLHESCLFVYNPPVKRGLKPGKSLGCYMTSHSSCSTCIQSAPSSSQGTPFGAPSGRVWGKKLPVGPVFEPLNLVFGTVRQRIAPNSACRSLPGARTTPQRAYIEGLQNRRAPKYPKLRLSVISTLKQPASKTAEATRKGRLGYIFSLREKIYRMKLVITGFSLTGSGIPAARPAWMHLRSQAMLRPSSRITCMPSSS